MSQVVLKPNVILFREDNPQDVTPQLQEGAFDLHGSPRHYMTMQKTSFRILSADEAVAVRQAYRELAETTKSPHIVIADLADKSRVPVKRLKSWLLAEARAGRARPAMGEPTLATQRQLAGALLIENQPYLYINLDPSTW